MKTYVLMIAATFPATHPRKGAETHFQKKILNGVQHVGYYLSEGEKYAPFQLEKIHTIRANYPLWEHRIREVQAGRAILSLRQWTGKPYKSTQIEFAHLGKDDGVGIQKLMKFEGGKGWGATHIENGQLPIYSSLDFCRNDGLNQIDFIHWFANYDLSTPMAVLHFTKYRY